MKGNSSATKYQVFKISFSNIFQKIDFADDTALNIEGADADDSVESNREHGLNGPLFTDTVSLEKRGQIPHKPLSPKMKLVDKMKNKLSSIIREKTGIENKVDVNDVQYDLKPHLPPDFDSMRFIKHPSFDYEAAVSNSKCNSLFIIKIQRQIKHLIKNNSSSAFSKLKKAFLYQSLSKTL